jgi:translation initiation factor IF-1
MVKNTTGGTKTKGLARKHQGAGGGGNLRIPQDELEKVAYVSKMLGNGMCHVYINDITEPIIAHIRKKFSGRHKRSNLIATGSCLLIGLREWENPVKNCDVINVYEHNDITTLLNLPAIKTNIIAPMFNNELSSINTIDTTDNFDFLLTDDNQDDDYDKDTKPPHHTNNIHNNINNIHNNININININDI